MTLKIGVKVTSNPEISFYNKTYITVEQNDDI